MLDHDDWAGSWKATHTLPAPALDDAGRIRVVVRRKPPGAQSYTAQLGEEMEAKRRAEYAELEEARAYFAREGT